MGACHITPLIEYLNSPVDMSLSLVIGPVSGGPTKWWERKAVEATLRSMGRQYTHEVLGARWKISGAKPDSKHEPDNPGYSHPQKFWRNTMKADYRKDQWLPLLFVILILPSTPFSFLHPFLPTPSRSWVS